MYNERTKGYSTAPLKNESYVLMMQVCETKQGISDDATCKTEPPEYDYAKRNNEPLLSIMQNKDDES